MTGPVFPPTGPTTLTRILKAYVYAQFADDPDIQAFNTAFNDLAQEYLDWFVNAELPIYTGLTGPLLDWVAAGLYGMTRPNLAYGSASAIGPLATYGPGMNVPLASFTTTGSAMDFTVNDDFFRRIITWWFFKGDGFNFSIEWLKRRVMRFLIGADGTAPNIDNTYPVSVKFGQANTVTIGIVVTNDGGFTQATADILQAAIISGAVQLPFQFAFSATVTNEVTTIIQGFIDVGGVLNLSGGAGNYPTTDIGLPAGSVWDADGLIFVVPGIDPNPNAPALFFGLVTADQLLALGGGNLPIVDPGVQGQLWNNGGLVCISLATGSPPTAEGGLTNQGGVINITGTAAAAFPTTDIGLPPGAIWDSGGLLYVVPGIIPNPNAPPVFYGSITAGQLLALGGGNLPLSDPGVAGQLWNDGGIIVSSLGVVVVPPVTPPTPPPGPPTPPPSPPITPGVEIATITFSDGAPTITVVKNAGVTPIVSYSAPLNTIVITASDGTIIGIFHLEDGVTFTQNVTVAKQQTTVTFSDGSAPVVTTNAGGTSASVAINNVPVPPTPPSLTPSLDFSNPLNFSMWGGFMGRFSGTFAPGITVRLDFSNPKNSQYLL